MIVDLGTSQFCSTPKNFDAPKSFYQKPGFDVFRGDISQNWLIKNDATAIRIFQGNFD